MKKLLHPDKMNEEKAVKALTAKLVNRFGSLIVRDKQYKDKLVKDTEYFYQVGNPFIIGFDRFNVDGEGKSHSLRGFVNNELTKKESGYHVYPTLEQAIDDEENCKDANYFFVDEPLPVTSTSYSGSSQNRGLSFFVTPYSIIGKKEINDLKEIFYKDVLPNVISAMNVLNIKNFVDIYDSYINLGKSFFARLEEDLKVIKSLIDFISNLDYLGYDKGGEISVESFKRELGNDIKSLNTRLKRIGVEKSISSKGATFKNFICKRMLSDVVEQILLNDVVKNYDDDANYLNDFFSFVFSLPYEDQNVESNKEILKSFSGRLDYVSILVKEYSQGECFQEYFSCLDDGRQKKIVSSLKSISRNPVCDSFLWGKGFRDVDLDYLDLYKKDAFGFIEYFGGKSPEEKKVILKDIMDCDSINKDVVDWLDENESELVKEVGLNG